MRFFHSFSRNREKRIVSLFVLLGTISAENLSFKDMAAEMGLNFVHDHGGTDQKFYVETMGSGCALLDYDNDGDLDVFFLQGAPLPGWKKEITLRNQLFRNDGDEFTDVTGESGLGDTSYGIGCAAADYDNVGDTDLYVSNFGPDILYRNEGDGTFADASYAAGISNPVWSASAAFFDADNDGFLDIYVSNYVEYYSKKIRGAETSGKTSGLIVTLMSLWEYQMFFTIIMVTAHFQICPKSLMLSKERVKDWV